MCLMHCKEFVKWLIFINVIQLIASASTFGPYYPRDALCSNKKQWTFETDGRASMALFELFSDPNKVGDSCTRHFEAPKGYFFIVRFYSTRTYEHNMPAKTHPLNGHKERLQNKTCSLKIYSDDDSIGPPWTIDPCKLSAKRQETDEYRLMPGKIKVVYEHNSDPLPFFLSLTVMSRFYQCDDPLKFPCLKVGNDPFLCISGDLVCDGINHCPKGIDYLSDEDPKMCRNRLPSGMSFWREISEELLRSLFRSDKGKTHRPPKVDPKSTVANNKETDEELVGKGTLTRGLSKYGPWGYLMMGMFISGIALITCGLWECCCKSNKPENNGLNDSGLSEPVTPAPIDRTNRRHGSSTENEPPNYDDLDSPPSYSILFPNELMQQLNKAPGAPESIPGTSSQNETRTNLRLDL